MKRMNRKTEYALMALKHMSHKAAGQLTTAKEVSEAFHIPFDATARVMQVMAQKNWLRSEQGATGGYHLTLDLGQASMQDLIEMIEGRTAVVRCLESSKPCEIQHTCNILTPAQLLNKKLNQFYESLSLRDLLEVNHG